WVTVRDKLHCSRTLGMAESFRVPRCFAVQSTDDVRRLFAEHDGLFDKGYVLKPRVGWGGHGVQVADAGDEPRVIRGNFLLSERIMPTRIDGAFWEAPGLFMAGTYLGGLHYASRSPLTNYWQGGTPGPLDDEPTALLAQPALEAVRMLDAAAETIHRLPQPPASPLTEVIYQGT